MRLRVRLYVMLLQQVLSVETFLTDIAIVRPLIQMSTLVILQIAYRRKLSPTVLAVVRMLACVDTIVNLKISFLRESFLTTWEIAFVSTRDLHVCSFKVLSQSSFALIFLFTNRALDNFEGIVFKESLEYLVLNLYFA